MAALDTLQTAYDTACTRYAADLAAYTTNGHNLSFTLDGVQVDWPAWERHLLDQVTRTQDALTKALELAAALDPFELQSDLGG